MSIYDQRVRQSLARQREEREAREAQEAEALEAGRRENAEARRVYLAGLAAAKAADARREEAATDAALAAAKERARRDWLLANPGKDGADFERDAWPLVRANLVEDAGEAQLRAARAALLRSGNYSF